MNGTTYRHLQKNGDEFVSCVDLNDWLLLYVISNYILCSEVMLCDFSAGVELVSFHHLTAREKAIENISEPLAFRSIEAGSWHNHFPGETRIHLNYICRSGIFL